MVVSYCKDLLYYLFEFLGSCLNFISAILGYYPRLELGIRFLYILEERRFSNETTQQADKRQDLHNEASYKMGEARKDL